MSATVAALGARRSPLLPMLLVAIGSVLFAANVGLVSGDAPHALLHLWPVVPILVGIELVLGRTAPARAFAAGAVVIALAVVLAVIAPESVIAGAGPGSAAAAYGPWHQHLWR